MQAHHGNTGERSQVPASTVSCAKGGTDHQHRVAGRTGFLHELKAPKAGKGGNVMASHFSFNR